MVSVSAALHESGIIARLEHERTRRSRAAALAAVLEHYEGEATQQGGTPVQHFFKEVQNEYKGGIQHGPVAQAGHREILEHIIENAPQPAQARQEALSFIQKHANLKHMEAVVEPRTARDAMGEGLPVVSQSIREQATLAEVQLAPVTKPSSIASSGKEPAAQSFEATVHTVSKPNYTRLAAISHMATAYTVQAQQEGGNAVTTFLREVKAENVHRQSSGLQPEQALLDQQKEVLRLLLKRDPHQSQTRVEALALISEDKTLSHLEQSCKTVAQEVVSKQAKAMEIRHKIHKLHHEHNSKAPHEQDHHAHHSRIKALYDELFHHESAHGLHN